MHREHYFTLKTEAICVSETLACLPVTRRLSAHMAAVDACTAHKFARENEPSTLVSASPPFNETNDQGVGEGGVIKTND